MFKKFTAITVVLLLFLVLGASAQKIKVIVWMEEIKAFEDHDTGSDEELSMRYSVNGVEVCATAPDIDDNKWVKLHDNGIDTEMPANYSTIPINIQCWEDDEGDRCVRDGGDDNYHGIGFSPQLRNYPPLTWHFFERVVNNNTASGHGYSVRYWIYWRTTPLEKPFRNEGSDMCYSETTVVSTHAHGLSSLITPRYRWTVFDMDNGGAASQPYSTTTPSFDIKTFLSSEPVTTRHLQVQVEVTAGGNIASEQPSPRFAITVQPRKPTVYLSAPTPIQCFEGKGAINVAGAFGGSTQHKFLLETDDNFPRVVAERIVPAGTAFSFGSLDPGAYKLYVSNVSGAGCTEVLSQNANLVIPPGPSKIVWKGEKENQKCAGVNSGRITLAAEGGAGSYEYFYGNQKVTTELTGLPVGTHTFRISDAKGCSVYETQTIDAVSPITFSELNVTDVKCKDGTDGSVSVTGVSGGKPFTSGSLYRYQLNGTGEFVELNRFDALAAGTYTVIIKDANSCTLPVQAVINEPASSVSGQLSITHVQCYGLNTGAFTVTGTGGAGNQYAFSLNAGAYTPLKASQSYSSLPAGDYSISVKDSRGCSSEEILVSVNQPEQLTANITSIPVSCDERGDGQLKFTVAGGTAPYEYFNTVSGITEPVPMLDGNYVVKYDDLQAGDYVLQIKDSRGCTTAQKDQWLEIIGHVTNAPALEIYINEQDVVRPSCNGVEDASVTIRAQGGTADYSFSLDDDTYLQEREEGVTVPYYTFHGFSGGIAQNFYVKDARNCKSQLHVTIPQTPLLTAQVSRVKDVDCFGNSTGEVELTAQGGTAPYRYSKMPELSYQASALFSSLPSGEYTFYVRDSKDCTTEVFQPLLQPAEQLKVDLTVRGLSCYGMQDGQIIVTATGGNGSYQYSVNGVDYLEEHIFDNLSKGKFDVSVKDAKNCFADIKNVEVIEPPQLVAHAKDVTPVTCFGGSDASFSIETSGGTAPYQYTLEGLSDVPESVTNLLPGYYSVLVTDRNECTFAFNVDLSAEPADIQIETQITPALCQSATGAATISAVLHAEAPYNIKWFDHENNELGEGVQLKDAVAGIYFVDVSDNRHCTSRKVIELYNDPGSLSASFSSIKPVTCSESENGSAVLRLAGGVSPYVIRWPDGEQVTVTDSYQIWRKFRKGVNSIQITDANGCISFPKVTVPGPDQLQLRVAKTEGPECFNTPMGYALLETKGGTPGYTYEIFKNGALLRVSDEPEFETLTAGTYRVAATDINGCQSNTLFQINERVSQLTLNVNSIIDASCTVATDGEIHLLAAGGTAPYQYLLLGAAGEEITRNTLASFTDLASGAYRINMIDAHGCSITNLPAVVAEKPEPMLNVLTEETICPGSCSGKLNIEALEPGDYSYTLGNISSSKGEFADLCAGEHVLVVGYASVCSQEKLITIKDRNLELELGEGATICQGQTVTLAPGIEGEYAWSSSNGYSSSESSVELSEEGEYSLSVTTPEGCLLSDSFTVTTSTDLLKADFIMADSALVDEVVVAIDLTSPNPDSGEWTFDSQNIGHQVEQSFYHNFTFKSPGTYTIELTVHLFECNDTYTHTVTAYAADSFEEPGEREDGRIDVINDVNLFPNPSNGKLALSLDLATELAAKVEVYNTTSRVPVVTYYHKAAREFTVNMDLGNVASGLYFMKLTLSNGDTKIVRFIVE